MIMHKKGAVVFFLLVSINTLISCRQTNRLPAEETRVLPFYSTADFNPRWITAKEAAYDSIHQIPSFRFVNQLGETVTEKTFSGKIYVTDFFFTACPGICKRLTTNLGLVQKAFLDDANILLLSHSVTPDSDSVPRLAQYANEFGVIKNKWHLVTGNRDSIYLLARRDYFADENMGQKKNSDDFLHTENVLLIDTHRRIRGVYKGTSVKDMNDLIADIKLLKQEE